MDFEDDFFDEYEDDVFGSFSGDDITENENANQNDLDPFTLRDPVSSYLFLSDDVQDELGNPSLKKLKCQLCGYEFLGRKTDHCPMCYGKVFREVL
jgi:rubrerythrin